MRRRDTAAIERMAARRRREDEAPRLTARVPKLEKLRLEVLEHSSSISRPENTHTRHVVVSSAPALFILPCHDAACKEGGHDLTTEILTALEKQKKRHEGEDACLGAVGTSGCSRILKYVVVATYQE